MDITQLRYFLAVAETLNYTRAAQKLYLSRQALRQALAAMESELRTPLFLNRRNKLSLTAAGEYLQAAGQEVLRSFDEMVEGMERFAQQETALNVSLSISLLPFLLPEMDALLKRFRAKHPDLALELSYVSNDEALRAVRTGQADCALAIWMPYRVPGVIGEALMRYGVRISYCCDQHSEWLGRPVTVEELAGHRCIGFGSLEESLLPLYDTCREKGITLDYEVVTQTIDAFYKISHNKVIGLDVEVGYDPITYQDICGSPLEGFALEIGPLLQEDSPRSSQAYTFCRFIAKEYQRMREEHGRSGMSPLTPV